MTSTHVRTTSKNKMMAAKLETKRLTISASRSVLDIMLSIDH
jgi:hypothetical protein